MDKVLLENTLIFAIVLFVLWGARRGPSPFGFGSLAPQSAHARAIGSVRRIAVRCGTAGQISTGRAEVSSRRLMRGR